MSARFVVIMADDLTFSAETVLKYLISNGGKVSNHDLVKHFKSFLSGPDSQRKYFDFILFLVAFLGFLSWLRNG